MTRVRALFLDRDGVIVRDDEAHGTRELVVLAGAAGAIRAAREAGFLVVVVTNQPVVARGQMTEDQVRDVHALLATTLEAQGAVIDRFYFCPHHPVATLPAYRLDCSCRKPRPGMLRQAAAELGIDLAASVMIGDRLSDVAAGKRAGCRTVLVETGMHLAPPIASPDTFAEVSPDRRAPDLAAAVQALLASETPRVER